MAGAMTVIQTLVPEKLTSHHVNGKPTGPFRKANAFERNVALEYKSVSFPFHLSRFTKVQSARGVSGAIQVLSSRVAEIYSLGVDDGTSTFLGHVVYDSSIRSRRRDGVKRPAHEAIMLCSNRIELINTI